MCTKQSFGGHAGLAMALHAGRECLHDTYLSCASCYAEAVIMPNCGADSLAGTEFGLSSSA